MEKGAKGDVSRTPMWKKRHGTPEAQPVGKRVMKDGKRYAQLKKVKTTPSKGLPRNIRMNGSVKKEGPITYPERRSKECAHRVEGK